ncbi:MAG: hypothetical protein WCK34_10865 [Bacteroidota bacterium]
MGNSSAEEPKAATDNTRKYFFRVTAGIEVILGAILLCLVFVYFFKHSIDLRTMIALSLIIIWFGVVIMYLAWAIYFYNVNMGLTDDDWLHIAATRLTGNPVTGPEENPNSDQSMGLPTGTVRAIIALTLLVAVLALVIIYFGNERSVRENEFLVDSLDFFKTAFLMMIAFYFGSKSLEFLKPSSGKNEAGSKTSNAAPPANAGATTDLSEGNVSAKTGENGAG